MARREGGGFGGCGGGVCADLLDGSEAVLGGPEEARCCHCCSTSMNTASKTHSK